MIRLFTSLFFILFSTSAWTADLKVGDTAPLFKGKTHTGAEFDLSSRKGKWTVLFFYPKAGTPGCTKQACAFRDSLTKIRDQGAEVYGISADTMKAQADFHKEHRLNFDLIADPEAQILEAYGTKMALLDISKRWTFIIGPDLKIRNLMKDVDPMVDSDRVSKELVTLKKEKI